MYKSTKAQFKSRPVPDISTNESYSSELLRAEINLCEIYLADHFVNTDRQIRASTIHTTSYRIYYSLTGNIGPVSDRLLGHRPLLIDD